MRLDPQVKERLKKTFSQELTALKETVIVHSTYKLSEQEMDAILSRFPTFSGYRHENVVDTSLIGGFVVQAGSQRIDLSVRNALHLLKKQLYESN